LARIEELRQRSVEVARLENKIKKLEERIAELERCKHSNHEIAPEAVEQIAEMVKRVIVRALATDQSQEVST